MFDSYHRDTITIPKLKHGQVALSDGHSYEPLTYEAALEKAVRIANAQKIEVQIYGIIKTIVPERIAFKNLKPGDKFIFATECIKDCTRKLVFGNPQGQAHYYSILKSKKEVESIIHSANPEVECIKLN